MSHDRLFPDDIVGREMSVVVGRYLSFVCTGLYWSKIANSYPPHPHSTPSLGVTPLNFGMSLICSETRMMGLPYGEEIVIVGQTMWTQSTSVTDGRTDGRTDGQNYDNKDRATQSVDSKNSTKV